MSPSTDAIRIAMWSGPRNISTAMMRSWGNRPDTVVIDEPFYAYYLKTTGKKHPGADDVIASGETDWRKVIERLTGPIPDGKRIYFQKQMTHHLLPEVDRQWLGAVTNCFLIRDPREVILSYIKESKADAGRPRFCAADENFSIFMVGTRAALYPRTARRAVPTNRY